MKKDKEFLTYNKQMRKLRNDKKISCEGSDSKELLVKHGYFNLINGYKNPFICSYDTNGNHIYLKGTSIEQILEVKRFDNRLRMFLLGYITQVEEEVRTLVAYKFDRCNQDGKISWYEISAYSNTITSQEKMNLISNAYHELSISKLDYVNFYKKEHEKIPTWIMMKVIRFSTFIDLVSYSKEDVYKEICELYSMYDPKTNKPNKKLLIGSLNWMRKVRNSCAHNERIYNIHLDNKGSKSGRIIESYLLQLPKSYTKDRQRNIFDLLVYFKYYLSDNDYKDMINELKMMLINLKNVLIPNAFDNVRGQMGIKRIDDLDTLISLPKNEIKYIDFAR